ncbi:hypothetical protein D3C81_942370 [compost metagenome]
MTGSCEQGVTCVGLFQRLALYPLFAALSFAGQDQRPAILTPALQHGAAAVFKQQQHRQVERRNGLQLTLQYTPLQPCTRGSAWQQIRPQALLKQWQPTAQAGAAGRPTVQAAQNQQAI